MGLSTNIQNDLRQAMKDKDAEKVRALRMLASAVKNEEIGKRPAVLEEADVIAVIRREIKKLKDAIEQFKQVKREDLIKSYQAEADIFGKYLPVEMSEEEIRAIIRKKLSESADKSFGAVMKAVMQELKGRAEGGVISRIVKEELA